MSDLRCTLKELIEATVRAILLRHGCDTCEASKFEVRGGQDLGANSFLAAVHAVDGREVLRIYDLDDLDRLTSDPLECRFLARTVQRLVRSLNISTA